MQVDENHNQPHRRCNDRTVLGQKASFFYDFESNKESSGSQTIEAEQKSNCRLFDGFAGTASFASSLQIRSRQAKLWSGLCGFYAWYGLGGAIVAPPGTQVSPDHAIGFDDLTIADSSLLPSKNEQSITRKDWKNGNATVRPDHKICGEKCLTLINSRKQIVTNQLMPNINSPDDHVFKQPMQWARKGLRFGHLLVDRGFSNKAVRLGIDFLTNALPDYSLGLISPPRARQTWVLTPEQTLLYKKRWQIEEVFRQLKDPQGRFRMVMCGVRRRPLREARVAIATLAWNMEHAIA